MNQTMKEHLERYVKEKKENLKNKETQAGVVEKNEEGAQPPNANEDAKADTEPSNKEDNESAKKESQDVANFGIVTDEDREADREALEKITKMIEERLKTRPLPPPPAQPNGDGSVNLTSEQSVKTRDGDSVVDTEKNGKGKRHFNSCIYSLLSIDTTGLYLSSGYLYLFLFLFVILLFRNFSFQILQNQLKIKVRKRRTMITNQPVNMIGPKALIEGMIGKAERGTEIEK